MNHSAALLMLKETKSHCETNARQAVAGLNNPEGSKGITPQVHPGPHCIVGGKAFIISLYEAAPVINKQGQSN